MSNVERYPLSWPTGWKRTSAGSRKPARFEKRVWKPSSFTGGQGYHHRADLTVADSVKRLAVELGRLGVLDGDWLISSNLRVRLDGLPYSNDRPPDDPGVAVYFRIGRGRHPRVLACDRWTTVAGNLAAVAAHIEAIRAIDRYGVGTLEQAFAGYMAIPQKTGGEDWKSEMGFDAAAPVDAEAIEARYRQLARERHPDSGGSHEAMARLNVARGTALRDLAEA